jgi:methionyl-tRNA formyltransferase
MRIVFMGSPELAVPSLRVVNEVGQIVGVITQPPRRKGRGQKMVLSPVAYECSNMGIDPMIPDSVRTPEFLDRFRQLEPDIAVVVAYGKILPPEMLLVPRLGCVNVHASLLPELRGAAPIQWAVARGYVETGVTLMQMDEGMDTGPILLQERTIIGESETASDLAGRLSLMGADILLKGLPALEKGELPPSVQDDSLATYAPLLKRENGLIDWSFDATKIANRVRGFTPWPGTYTTWRGKRLLVNTAEPIAALPKESPGEVLKAGPEGILVACGTGALTINSLKPEGSREMTAAQFLAGHGLKTGDLLGDQ